MAPEGNSLTERATANELFYRVVEYDHSRDANKSEWKSLVSQLASHGVAALRLLVAHDSWQHDDFHVAEDVVRHIDDAVAIADLLRAREGIFSMAAESALWNIKRSHPGTLSAFFRNRPEMLCDHHLWYFNDSSEDSRSFLREVQANRDAFPNIFSTEHGHVDLMKLIINHGSVDEWLQSTANPDMSIREHAAARPAIEPFSFDPSLAIPALCRMLEDTSSNVQRAATLTLLRVGEPSALDSLQRSQRSSRTSQAIKKVMGHAIAVLKKKQETK